MTLFRQKYTLRRHKPQKLVNGYGTSLYEDVSVFLDVQPMPADELQVLPEGERSKKRLQTFGSIPLTASDVNTGTPGDWLWYEGRWYECVSAVYWNHTPLTHIQGEFTALEHRTPPPEGEL